MIENGANIHANNDEALRSAVGDFDVVKFLLEQGANVHASGVYGTALQLATENEENEVVEFLENYIRQMEQIKNITSNINLDFRLRFYLYKKYCSEKYERGFNELTAMLKGIRAINIPGYSHPNVDITKLTKQELCDQIVKALMRMNIPFFVANPREGSDQIGGGRCRGKTRKGKRCKLHRISEMGCRYHM